MQQNSRVSWPALPYDEWRDASTLHLWLQMVGKIRLVHCPWLNHSWHVTMRTSARGLGTGLMWHENGAFQIEFDFIDHRLVIRLDDGRVATLPLGPESTASFYRKLMGTLADLGVPVNINTMPNELADAIPFDSMTYITPTIPSTSIAIGASSCKSSASSRIFAQSASASAAPFIFSGAALI